MNWLPITSETELSEVFESSKSLPVIIFKHSTRCSISAMAKRSFESNWNHENAQVYLLDLIAHRSLSNQIAETFSVKHESPQVLLLKNGKCVFHVSHSEIDADAIREHL